MYDYIQERTRDIAKYIIDNKCTVRTAAAAFGISKSTVWRDMTVRLPEISSYLSRRVRKVLNKNKAERHIRGGIATKEKFMLMKNSTTIK